MDPEFETSELAPETPDEVVKPPEVVTPPVAPTDAPAATMEDTIRSKLREMNTPAETPPVTPPTGDDRPRDPATGKFIKADGTLEEPAAVTSPVTPPVAPPVETPPVPGQVVDMTKAPTSWKGAAQAEYAKLPPIVQAEVHRREADFHKGLSTYKQESDNFKLLDAEIRPYEAMIRAARLTPQAIIKDFMNTAYTLKTGSPEEKTRLMVGIAEQYGIDLNDIAEVAKQLPPPMVPDPKYAELETKFSTLEQTLKARDEENAQREYAALQAETLTFAQKPENKHYEAVRLDMAALMQSGRANDLQDAYNKAIWTNPEVRAILLSEQEAERRKQAADKAAAAKKAASTNVAPRGTLPAAPVVGTMEDTIRSQYRKIAGG